MGMRIHKDIGYIVDTQSEVFARLFQPDYQEILSEFDEEEDLENEFFNQLGQWQFSGVQKAYNTLNQRSIIKDSAAGKLSIFELIKRIGYDSTDYLLFGHAHHVRDSRRDDSIDYYEAEDTETHVRYLQAGIYPRDGFIYKGGIENKFSAEELSEALAKPLEIGEIYSHNELFLLFPQRGNGNHDYAKVIIDSGSFHPAIDNLIYPIARLSGMLKPEVSEMEFNLAMRPAIVTHWG